MEIRDFCEQYFEIPHLDLQKVSLVPSDKTLTPFEKFLLSKRIMLFFILSAIHSTKKSFIIGYEKNSVSDYSSPKEILYDEGTENEYTEKIYPQIDLGLSIVQEKYSDEEVFQFLLSKLQFDQIQSNPVPLPTTYKSILRDEVYVLSENIFIVSTDGELVLTENQIFVANDCLNDEFLFFKEKATELFTYAQKHVSVPHEIYISWLRTWFGHRIKILKLDHN